MRLHEAALLLAALLLACAEYDGTEEAAADASTVRVRLRRLSWGGASGAARTRPASWLRPVTPPPGEAELSNFRDSQYYAVLGFGTPPQYFTVLCDTGSPVAWLPSAAWCISSGGCDGHNGYAARASSTAQAEAATVSVVYGDGSRCGLACLRRRLR